MTNNTIHYEDTLEITYSVSNDTGNLEDIIDINVNEASETISNLENKGDEFKNVKKFTWSPDEENVGDTYTFAIGEQELSIKLTNVPENVVDNYNSVDDPDEAGVYQEGDSLSDYYDEENSGDFDYFERTTERSFTGEHSLEFNSTSGDTHGITSLPNDGLNRYPEKGDTFEVRVYIVQIAQNAGSFGFGLQDYDWNNGYGTYIDDSTIGIESNTKSVDIESYTGEWLRFEIDWADDGTLTHTVEEENGSEIVSVSAQDTEYSSGGFGFRYNVTGTGDTIQFYLDDWRVI